MKNKKILLIVLGVILLAAVAAGICIGIRIVPAVNHAVHISELLQPLTGAEIQSFHIKISTKADADTVDLESDVYLVTEEGEGYLVLEQEGTAVYIKENVLFLENGQAFKLGEKLQTQAASYEALLPQIGALYDVLKITAAETDAETVYSVTVTGEQMQTLLEAVSFDEALPVAGIESLNLQLTEQNGQLKQICFSGNGDWEGRSVALEVRLSCFRLLASGDYPVPEEVKQAAATVDPSKLFSLTEDLYRLVLALTPLFTEETIDGTLEVNVDCGMVQLDREMKLSDLQASSDGQLDPEQLQTLPETLVWLCMEGDIRCSANGSAYEYALELEQKAMDELAEMILPELQQYGVDLTAGKLTVQVVDGAVTSMELSIEGKITVLFAQIPASIRATLSFD